MSSRKQYGEADRSRGLPRKAKSKAERKETTTMAHEDEKPKSPPESQASGRSMPSRGTSTGPGGKVLTTEKQQFVIAPRRVGFFGTMAVQPLAFNLVEQTLRASPDVELADTIGPRGLMGTLAEGLAGPPT